jgi:microcystin degradation protein MlrC
MSRIGIVGVFHETNSFSAHRTEIEAFRPRWYHGAQILTAFTGSRTVAGGFLDENAAGGQESVPVFATYATPSGPISRVTFDTILATIADALRHRADELDGLLLELHGDMDVEGSADPEEEIARLVRQIMGDRPVSAVLDFHANMATRRLDDVDVLVGYRDNPHVDTYDRGREASLLLQRMLQGEAAPVRAHRGLGIVAPPVAQRTAIEPFASLNRRARELAEHPSIWSLTVHGGYAYLDADYTGLGFTAFADAGGLEVAEQAVTELQDLALALRPAFDSEYATAAPAVADAVDRQGIVVIADTGDNINGGSPGDTTWLCQAARAHPDARFLTSLCDPFALERLRGVPLGAAVEISVGGWSGETAGEPLRGTAVVLARSDGVFTNEGPMSTGNRVDMGEACLVRLDNLDIVIQRRATQPNDPQLFLHLGVEPADFDALLLKGAAAIRAGWAPYAEDFIDAGTRGDTDSVLDRLPYRRFERR